MPDTFIRINSFDDHEINFDVFYFDKVTNFVLHVWESTIFSREGNAFGFEIEFKVL